MPSSWRRLLDTKVSLVGTVKGWLAPGRSPIALTPRGGRYRRELTRDGAFSVTGILETTAREHGLESGGGLGGAEHWLAFRPEGCYAIENTVGSASQGYHTDYAHSQVGHLHGTPWYPRSAIWAALAAFEIGVRDGRVIRVPRDHVIFFMADFWHCGGAGLSPEPRFHGFQLASWTQIPTGVYT